MNEKYKEFAERMNAEQPDRGIVWGCLIILAISLLVGIVAICIVGVCLR